MPPGPPNLGDNRFAPLLSPPRKKRAINDPNFHFPSLTSTTINNLNHAMDNPKYIIISCAEANKKLSSYSCFGVYNALQAIDKGILSISMLRDGNLLILVKSKVIADKFLKRNDLPGVCRITSKLHSSLNFVKGTIYAPYLNEIPEEEIVKELTPVKVVGAHKFTKVIDGSQKPTGVVLLTFDLFHLPKKIQVAWNNALVKEYIPNPMRCKTCQRLGHTAKHCSNPAACVSCSLPPHLPERSCTQLLCANCQGAHVASSRDCPKYMELKQILKIKINNKCSLHEAKKIFKATTTNNNIPTTSYASIAAPNYSNPTADTTTKNNDNTQNLTTITKKKNTNDINTDNSTLTFNDNDNNTTQHTVNKSHIVTSTMCTAKTTDIESIPKTAMLNNNNVTNNNYSYFTIPSNLPTTSLNKSKLSINNNSKPNNTTQTIDLDSSDNEQNRSKQNSHSYNLRSSAQ